MKLLAIETATDACSAALWRDGRITDHCEHAPQRHAELILPMVDALLAEAGLKVAELDAIAFGRGPGSFTGLRIAAGVAQGLAFAAGKPVIGISTLAALAQGVASQGSRVLAALDARMGEVYWGLYQADAAGLMRLAGAEMVCPPERVSVPEEPGWIGAGNGWRAHSAALRARVGAQVSQVLDDTLPRAGALLPLAVDAYLAGQVQPAEAAVPVYLRDEVVRAQNK
jgi:tRNA threonylcarbamoyladenosine biosynthesis protein TsaB